MTRHGLRRSCGRTVFGAITVGITAVVALPALAGCASDVSGTAAAAEVDVRQLPVGNYPTAPLDARMTYEHGVGDGRPMAIARLAGNTVIGTDVDPGLSHNVMSKALRFPEDAYSVLADPVRAVLEPDHMQYGFSAAASTEDLSDTTGYTISGDFQPFGGANAKASATSFNMTILQFPDAQQARTAAQDMDTADFTVAADRNVHVTLAGHADAKAHWQPGIPSLAATIADGLYVASVYVQLPTADLDGLGTLADKILAAQLPMLDDAPGLSPEDIYRLDPDPDAMLRRTLHPGQSISPDADSETTHTAHGYLHYIGDLPTWKALLDNNGVDRVSTARSGGLLFRTRDPKSAAALATAIAARTTTPAEVPDKVPDTTCAEANKAWTTYKTWDTNAKYICTLHYDRYVARVSSDQLIDVQQKAAAQYAVLANSQPL
ncbi:hypothetical protein [Nocardia sp. NBC_00511]|uniref:DUF7373 family lipoprotein n=1 Tax=Nocardia sp. NBC_00511 TaxID=2903591 RepID=UPI0030E46A7E